LPGNRGLNNVNPESNNPKKKETENVRATVISQLRNCARALAKEWECSSDKKSGKRQDEPNSFQRSSRNLELFAIACTSGGAAIIICL